MTETTVQQSAPVPKQWWWKRYPKTVKAVKVVLLVLIGAFFISEQFFVELGWAIAIRKYLPSILLVGGIFFGIYKLIAMKSKPIAVITLVVILTGIVGAPWFFDIRPWELHGFLSSYVRYQTLNRVNIASLPETDHEAMQPKVSIHNNAESGLGQSGEQVSEPHFVRIDSEYRWTLAKEPIPELRYARARWVKGIDIVYSVPATVSSLDFSSGNQSKVDFAIGETLLFGGETKLTVLRALPLLDLLNVETTECRFLKDDSGQWVQVVPLIKWRGNGLLGILFPQPEFYGVHVITQQDGHLHSVLDWVVRCFVGAGTTYTLEQMQKIPYLRNQNLMPYKVKESIALSFRFQNGFWGPVYGSHDGDARIPKLEGGIGKLPVTAFFKMSGVAKGTEDMLYDYYGLEPYDTSKTGLVASLFIPSDGRMIAYVHNHTDRDNISGISFVLGKAKASMRQFDWNVNKIADVRPYNRKMNGRMCHNWLFSIVTESAGSHGYSSEQAADVGLADPERNMKVLWFDPTRPQTWPALLDSLRR